MTLPSKRHGFIAVALLFGLAVVLGHSAWFGVRTLHPPRLVPTNLQTFKARAELPGLENVTLHTEDGLALRGWFSPGSRRSVVVLVSGHGANRMQLEPDAAILARHGHGVLLYDSRACGESEGDIATYGDREQRDVRAAVDFVSRRPEVDSPKIALLGHSVGASTVAMAARSDPRVRAVILYATWTSLDAEIRDKAHHFGPLSWGPVLLAVRAYGVRPDNVRPIDHVAEIAPRPLLMITGTADTDTPVSVMEEVFAAAREPKALWVIPGAAHGTYVKTARAEWETRVIAFLERALPDAPR